MKPLAIICLGVFSLMYLIFSFIAWSFTWIIVPNANLFRGIYALTSSMLSMIIINIYINRLIRRIKR